MDAYGAPQMNSGVNNYGYGFPPINNLSNQYSQHVMLPMVMSENESTDEGSFRKDNP